MSNLRFTKDHEWITEPQNGVARMGISDYAQNQLGDIVYVELKDEGVFVEQGEIVATIESVKAATDVYAPVSGNIKARNEALENEQQLVNEDPFGAGWLLDIAIKNPDELESLMTEEAYNTFLETAE
jgi:glycine cleavage system H protein